MKTKIEKLIRSLVLISLVLSCFAFLTKAQAVNPPPDGGYSNGNTAEGTNSLFSLTSGVWNTALGFEALNNDTAGGKNTATGLRTLVSDTTGSFNTATGVYALYGNTTGWYNSAIGANTLSNNITGNYNTAAGYGALNHTHSDANTAVGFAALFVNTTGASNVAVGSQALNKNTTGTNNTANGVEALFSSTTGDNNTAIGVGALFNNTTGTFNTATGVSSLLGNTTGVSNTANGVGALFSNTTGSNNIALGAGAGGNVTTASNVICIGIGGDNVDNSCFIGNIFGTTSSGGTAVFVNSDGQLGTTTSSRRFKEEIKPIDRASEVLFALKPVAFRYKKDIDPQGIPQLGLVAEDVEKVKSDLVVRDKEGKPYSVRYDQVNAMLLNEFLKEHSTVQELKSAVAKQEAIIAQQQKQMATVAARLDEQDSKSECQT